MTTTKLLETYVHTHSVNTPNTCTTSEHKQYNSLQGGIQNIILTTPLTLPPHTPSYLSHSTDQGKTGQAEGR